MASHELTLKDYQKQLKDHVKSIYENYTEILRTKTEHLNFEVSVKSAEIIRSYESLMQLVAEIRTFLIINDLLNPDQPNTVEDMSSGGGPSQFGSQSRQQQQLVSSDPSKEIDDKLVRLRDEIAMFLYELEMPCV